MPPSFVNGEFAGAMVHIRDLNPLEHRGLRCGGVFSERTSSLVAELPCTTLNDVRQG